MIKVSVMYPNGNGAKFDMGHLLFDSIDAFFAAFAAHGESIIADIPNYTNTQPVIQVSQTKM